LERASIGLEAIALAAIVYGGSLMIPPEKEKENCYEGRINAEKRKKSMREGLMLLKKQRRLSG
jgi:hypothetical protein